MNYGLGRTLKRRGIKQRQFREVLAERYGLALSPSCISNYCNAVGVGYSDHWNTIKRCLRIEYGIEYNNGRWQEVQTHG